MKTTDNEKDTSLLKRVHKKLLYGFLVQLFSHPSDQELFLINKKLFEKIKEEYEEKIEGLKDILNKMTPSESYELKEDMKKDLMEEYKDNLKKEIRDLEEQLKTAEESKKLSIEEKLKKKRNEALSYTPAFKYNSYYKSCPDYSEALKEKFGDVFSRYNLYAHFMVEYSGGLLLPDGSFDGININKKIFFYMTKSLNKKCAGLRREYVSQLNDGYYRWKKEKREGNGRPAEYVIIFMDEYEKKYYYMYAETFIKEFYAKAKSKDLYYSNNSRWIHIPFELIKKHSYWIVDAPSKTKEAEEEAYNKLKEDCKRPVLKDGRYIMYTGGRPNFDPDKSDMGELIWTREHYREYIKGAEQFLALFYDKDGNKKEELKYEIDMKSLSELFDFVKKYIGYDKNPRTFRRKNSKGIGNWEKYIKKGFEIKVAEKDIDGQFTGKYKDLIVYILSSESIDIEQDFSKTRLEKNVDGNWCMVIEEEFVKRVINNKNGTKYCINKEYFYEKYMDKNAIPLLHEDIKAAGGLPEYTEKLEKLLKNEKVSKKV